MTKKLTKHGNSMALVLDKPILDLLGIDADTTLDVKTDGKKIVIEPVRQELTEERLQSILESLDQQYGNTFKRLAE